MNNVAIIQARMGSHRLPGKVMMDLGGKPVIQRIIDRVKKIPLINQIVLAVPDEDASKPLAKIAQASGIECVQGSEHDVLWRYHLAADATNADLIMRLTADNPLIDWTICNQVLSLALRARCHYVSNVPDGGRTFPRGLDCEVFTRQMLDMAHKHAIDGYDREHVTPWIRRNAKHQEKIFCPEDLSEYRLTLDTKDDLEYLQSLFALFPKDMELSFLEIMQIIKAHPELHHPDIPSVGAA